MHGNLSVQFQKNIHTSPIEGQWKFQGGGVWQRQKFFKEKCGTKLEFLEGRGVNQNNPPWGVWIFLGATHLLKVRKLEDKYC